MPNSLLWIALVAMWLFVLLPMQAKRRPRIRQTTDVALATRVLDRDQHARQTRRGPASGHRSDPNWRPDPNRPMHAEDWMEAHARTDASYGEPDQDELDDDFGYDEADHDTRYRRAVPQYDDEDPAPHRRGRGGFDPEADAIARAARYSFRQRAVLGLVLAAIMTAALALIVSPTLWWVSVAAVLGLVGYLVYLRRQVQFEQEIRRRRMARLTRSRLGVESREDEELKLIPSRLRRPGAVVLEIDDGDPVFDHLDHYDAGIGEEDGRSDMRRVVGE
ncbi:hypothetical protein GCM10023094_49020 [Rhodococcus olei]|uniref:Transmembrane protein n=1 Tax=Rhodococcus olei TaxID=2161675 RepID=A0ABP8PL71_9NOCA